MGQLHCIPFRLRKRKQAAASSLHHTTGLQFATDFATLPEDTKKHILSLLPVVDIVRSRLVCTEWGAILSSSSMSSPSSSSHSETDFWRSFWMKNRPPEKWLFLHTGQNLTNTLIYDVQHQICYGYPACPKLPMYTLAVPSQFICNTTANGLVFLAKEMRAATSSENHSPVVRIWIYNPLTGRETQLPDVQVPWQSSTWRIFAKEDVLNRNMGPHYMVLLLEKTCTIELRHQNLPQVGLQVFLYSSREKSWQTLSSLEVRRNWRHSELNRFCEHDLIVILEANAESNSGNVRLCTFYLSGLRDPSLDILPHSLEPDCYVKWFNVENFTWNSCAIFPPEDLRCVFKFKHFYLFDRNKELVLLACLVRPEDFGVDFRVYKSTTVITPDTPPSWMFLSSIPNAVAHSAGCCSLSHDLCRWRTIFHNLAKFQVFPLPDEIQGDKLIIIIFQDESFSVVSFNLESSPAEAWRTLTATPDLGMPDQQRTGGRTPLEEKIGHWTRLTTQAFRDSVYFRALYQSGSQRGFTLEPRLYDL